jgi:hypothetical protein
MCIEASSAEANDPVTARLIANLIAVTSVLTSALLGAPNVPVRYKEGLTHGFVVLSTAEGNPTAVGDVTEVTQGNRVTIHVVFHFKDGSVQDETTVFSQRQKFSLISYRLMQKGPTFPHPTEISVVTASGQVRVQYTDDKGNEKTENERQESATGERAAANVRSGGYSQAARREALHQFAGKGSVHSWRIAARGAALCN